MSDINAMDAMDLSTLCVIRIDGPDAGTFLQGQMTRDVASIGRDFVLTGFCTPQGKLYATPRILKHEGGFLLALPQSQSDAFMKRLSHYVLRSKVSILLCPDQTVRARMEDGHVVLAMGVQPLQAVSDESSFWEAQARDAQPWVFPETEGQFVPQVLDFDRFDAVSYTKGCYTGQEIVGRIHWQGKVSKRLAAFACESTLEALPGETLLTGSGEPVATVLYGSGRSLLAVLDADAPQSIRTQQGAVLVPVAQ